VILALNSIELLDTAKWIISVLFIDYLGGWKWSLMVCRVIFYKNRRSSMVAEHSKALFGY
jgi:hypothetical protein